MQEKQQSEECLQKGSYCFFVQQHLEPFCFNNLILIC